jgi:hypothetical protein
MILSDRELRAALGRGALRITCDPAFRRGEGCGASSGERSEAP